MILGERGGVSPPVSSEGRDHRGADAAPLANALIDALNREVSASKICSFGQSGYSELGIAGFRERR